MGIGVLFLLGVLWVLQPLIAGAIAYRKGLGVADAVITAVFVGVFGIVIAAMREPDYLALEERRVRMGQAKRCGWCMTLGHPAARICPACHAPFDQPPY